MAIIDSTRDALIVLNNIDPGELKWHADRYAAAQMLVELLQDVQGGMAPVGENALKRAIECIADECELDGADYGHIPCLGGPIDVLWGALYSWAHGLPEVSL